MDPNKTVITGPPGSFDPNKTQVGAPVAADPNKTAAMAAVSQVQQQALAAEIIPGREATMANGPAREQFLLELSSAGQTALPGLGVGVARTPLNLCLVIDRSGSMEGSPLEYVKQACNHVVDLLSPNDVLSIVTFEEVVEVLMPPQLVTTKEAIKAGISKLAPGNTTNLYDGIALAMAQILQNPDPSRATRMIVLTDGDPTSGIKDHASLVQHAGDVKSRGITITFLGFGPDYNEELLAGMAKRAGGNYYYIPQPNLIPEVFRTELEKLSTVVAQNLKLDVRTARWVSLRSAGFQAVGADNREFTLNLADMERGATMQQVLDFEFANHPLGHYRVASGRLSFDNCLTGRPEAIDLDFVIEFSSDSGRYSVSIDPRVRQAADIQAASRVVEKTIMGLKSGQITVMSAVADLQKTQMLLMQEGRTQDAQEVTLALRAIQQGDTAGAEKTLMGTMVNLDQGKK